MHPAIVEAELFEAVQRQLDANARRRRASGVQHEPAPLKGRIFDADGRPMSPTFAYGQQKKRYRYYASPALRPGQRADRGGIIRRIPAQALEAKLAEIVRRVAASGSSDPLSLLTRVEIYPDALHLLMPIDRLPAMQSRLMPGERLDRDPTDPSQLRLMLPVRLQFHGGRTRIIGGAEPGGRPDPVLVKALRSAHAMLGRDTSGNPVLEGAPASTYQRRLLRLAFLAPELQRAILSGRQPAGLTLAALMEAQLPLLWTEQAGAFEAATPA